jgi:hypothetical protein
MEKIRNGTSHAGMVAPDGVRKSNDSSAAHKTKISAYRQYRYRFFY